VVVVDDASDDATSAVAARFPFVTVLRNEAPPPGWFGKPWACQLGADHTDAPLLCFLDADVRLRPGALGLMADQVRRRGGLVSMQPWHLTRRPYEQASALFNVISVMGVGMGASLTGRPPHPTGAFGPAMMTMREDYELVGGHASVATEVIEDIALARVYREHDREVAVIPGRGLLGYRMYPDGTRALLEGWTKNFALGAGNTPLWRLLAVFLWLAAMGTVLTSAVAAADGRVGWIGPAALWIAFSWQLRGMFKVVGSFGWLTALAFPLLLGLFFLVFFTSLWMTLVRRQVRWRGRTLSVGATR
jgi:4,4'-diaponeurosporenoate glycosyltransferase